MTKVRIDKYLVEKEEVENRSKVKNLIRQNLISVNDKKITKPGFLINPETDSIHIEEHTDYVSRSAHKLADSLSQIDIDVKGLVCADIGASTGGFTQVLLEKGAEHVHAVDVGTDQLHPKLQNNPKVTSLENTNAREEMPIPQVDFMVADLSFISSHKYVLNLFKYLKPKASLLLLFKPQFEVGSVNIQPNGVVKSQKHTQKALQDFESFLHQNKLYLRKVIKTSLLGKRGNQEYFLLISR
jgi:23S rRNA (cytidine1920-2'-O)/16S rRNA (cytidine1409-2'-O)-methyltransferase